MNPVFASPIQLPSWIQQQKSPTKMLRSLHVDSTLCLLSCIPGYNLLAVATHELGHSLGLSHSRDPSAIMYPNYRSRSSTQYLLSEDDVLGIQSLYGEEPNKRDFSYQEENGKIHHTHCCCFLLCVESGKPTSGAGATTRPNNCDSLSLDAALILGSDLVFFRNGYVLSSSHERW